MKIKKIIIVIIVIIIIIINKAEAYLLTQLLNLQFPPSTSVISA